MVTARNVAAEWSRRPPEYPLDATFDQADERAGDFASLLADDQSLAAHSFRSLPARWQEVLWYSEVEQMKPAEIAPLLGMRPNAVAALAVRAREGLRQGWIQAHLRASDASDEHAWTLERAGRYARGALSNPHRRIIDHHLEQCPECRLAYDEVERAASAIATVLMLIVLGAGASSYAVSATARRSDLVAENASHQVRVTRWHRFTATTKAVAVSGLVASVAGSAVVASAFAFSPPRAETASYPDTTISPRDVTPHSPDPSRMPSDLPSAQSTHETDPSPGDSSDESATPKTPLVVPHVGFAPWRPLPAHTPASPENAEVATPVPIPTPTDGDREPVPTSQPTPAPTTTAGPNATPNPPPSPEATPAPSPGPTRSSGNEDTQPPACPLIPLCWLVP
ncbi:zf-HC2 domain-containing protein [Microbacterium testaceum]|uniref:zf-HC2 domain-containing protein n=1 Tax=Microbacterium testaceum TaxID=2033 RepID=UPI0038FCB27B